MHTAALQALHLSNDLAVVLVVTHIYEQACNLAGISCMTTGISMVSALLACVFP